MALNLQNIIDSSIAKSGGAGNFASADNASLIEPTTPAPSAVVPVKEISAPQAPLPNLSAPVPTSQVATTVQSDPRFQAEAQPIERTPTNEGQSNLAQEIINLSSTDLSGARQELRADNQVAEKEERARRLSERIIARDNSYRDQREALEENPEGKLRGALNAELNDLERKRSRELADLSFSYNVALGDLQAAQTIVDDRVSDMEADIARRTKAYETAFQMAQNDLTESEKIEVQQAFQREQAEIQTNNQKEIARFKYELDAPQRAFENEMQAYKIAAEAATASSAQGISPVTGKAFNQDQNNAGTFALRIEQSEDILSQGKDIHIPFLPQFAKSQDRRQFEQAEANFITAVLRRESGAAISAEEFEDARKVYIPVATDDEDTLQRKTQARATVLQGMKNASVGAYDQLKQQTGTASVTNTYLDNLDSTLSAQSSPYSLYLSN